MLARRVSAQMTLAVASDQKVPLNLDKSKLGTPLKVGENLTLRVRNSEA